MNNQSRILSLSKRQSGYSEIRFDPERDLFKLRAGPKMALNKHIDFIEATGRSQEKSIRELYSTVDFF